MNCQICDETLNRSNRQEIQCPYCQFGACRKCCETYILGEPMPKCMAPNCGREWTRQFITTIFTKLFVSKTLKTHRENVLFDQERALLPATQPIVERIILRERNERELRDINRQIRELNIQRYEKQTEIYRLTNNTTETPLEQERRFVRACPEPECRGFLSTQWKCGLCEKWTCPECHIVKGDQRDDPNHVCNPDDVATARLLDADTKPCPRCATGIFKIDGCDQMWCIQCHTAFSWRTGRIEDHVHNPHYYEWLRRTSANGEIPRNPGDVPQNGQCPQAGEQEITNRLTTNMLNRIRDIKEREGIIIDNRTRDRDSDDDTDTDTDADTTNRQREQHDRLNRQHIKLSTHISKTAESIIHLRRYILPQYQYDRVRENELLRIQYMRNQIDEQTFKTKLQRTHKKIEKAREVREIVELLINTTTDIVLRFSDELNRCTHWQQVIAITTLTEIDRIVEYANECLTIVSKTYVSVPLSIRMRSSKDKGYNPVLISG